MALVLAVDDDASIRVLLENALIMMGHECVLAADGEEALEKMKAQRFDLVLLDIMMPRLNGYEVLEKMRAAADLVDIPVIVITAKHDPEGVLREVDSGAVDHIAKPFLPSELEDAVERALTASPEIEERRRKLAAEAEIYKMTQDLYQEGRASEEAAEEEKGRRKR